VEVALVVLLLFAVFISLPGCLEKTVLVPRVDGMTIAEASKVLREVGLTVEGRGDVAAAGDCFVSYTEPPVGKEIKEGSPVRLVMAVEVPNLIGYVEPEAIETLGSLGLEVVVERAHDELAAHGTVVSLEPGVGMECTFDTRVKMKVSKGSAFATCPECLGTGWVYEYSNCDDDSFKWCRDEVQVSCKHCNGTGKVPRDENK
jgi:beta-lactam-binding protein with PASTA domain